MARMPNTRMNEAQNPMSLKERGDKSPNCPRLSWLLTGHDEWGKPTAAKEEPCKELRTSPVPTDLRSGTTTLTPGGIGMTRSWKLQKRCCVIQASVSWRADLGLSTMRHG